MINLHQEIAPKIEDQVAEWLIELQEEAETEISEERAAKRAKLEQKVSITNKEIFVALMKNTLPEDSVDYILRSYD
ncbi:MAG: hypothetical protein MRQ13_01730 [Candidatus Midichloria sp.]|nr:hypothetical protein [Candidatus Midichloria sp.]